MNYIKRIAVKLKNLLSYSGSCLSKDDIFGKILDIFTVAEIRRSNAFKAVGRWLERLLGRISAKNKSR